jgi:hypothetical protein
MTGRWRGTYDAYHGDSRLLPNTVWTRTGESASVRAFCQTKPSGRGEVHVQRERRNDSSLAGGLEPLGLVERSHQAPLEGGLIPTQLVQLDLVGQDALAPDALDLGADGAPRLLRDPFLPDRFSWAG